MTEWNEFRNLDWPRIRAGLAAPRLLDCRNLYDPREMAELGFEYVSVGRPQPSLGEGVPAAGDRILSGHAAAVS